MLGKLKWKKNIILVWVLIIMGGYTFSERAFAHDSELASDDQTNPQLLIANAVAGQGEILYDLTYVGANVWRFSNVDVGPSPAGTGGYKTIDISYPAELQLKYSAPAGWTFTAPHTENGTTSLHISIADQSTQGKPEQIEAFLTAASTYLKLVTAGKYPAEQSEVNIVLSEQTVIQYVDAEGKGHYYEFVSGLTTWQKSYNAARARTYNGLNGYLATLTSIEEQNYVFNNIGKYAGWLGGTRARFANGTRLNNEMSISENFADYTISTTTASDWYWACGPEAGLVFYNRATYGGIDGTVNGVFNFFSNPVTYNRYPEQQSLINQGAEPNSVGEGFLEFAQAGTSSWNDVRYNVSTELKGYYVEYSGEKVVSGGARLPMSALITTTVNTSEGGSVSPGGIWAFGSSHPLTATPNTGWRFTGWTIVSGVGTLSTTTNPSTTFTVAGGPATIRADFKKETYTVTFESNGGTPVPDDQVIDYGNKVTEPTAPTLTGYTFAGWYTDDKTFENPWNFDTDTVAGNMTLYAKWTAVAYTVTFESNGGTAVPDLAIDYGEKVTEPTAPTRTGYTFAGWYTDDKTFVNPWNFDTDTVAGSMTLYANWTAVEYTVTFVSNGGTAVSDLATNYGENVTEPIAPTKTGFTFAGWYTDNNTFENPWNFDTDTVTGSVILYAKWDKEPEPNPSGATNPSENKKPTINGSGSTKIDESSDQTSPQTGDYNRKFVWVLLLASALIIMLTIIIRRRKKIS